MIEDLIYKALSESKTLNEALTSYDGQPAIFYERAAHDLDANWNKNQFPRCVYNVEWAYDAERTKAGVLTVDLIRLADMGTPIEIADALVGEISGMFMTQDGQTYSIIWSRSDAFETEGAEPKKLGISVFFDIIAYPIQQTTTPDPVLSTMSWISKQYGDLKVIGATELDEIWFPSDDNPACYVRMSGESSTVRPSYSVTWLRAKLVVHIICPSIQARLKWLKSIADVLALEAEIIMEDESPMFIKTLAIDSGSNPISAGQMSFDGEYGVLRKQVDGIKINNVKVGTGVF